MTKQEFLKQLKNELEINGIVNVAEILSDYEEHFTHGLAKGKLENEIANSLGSPSTIAKAYKTDTMIQEIKNPDSQFRWGLTLNVLLRLLVIAPFNFFFLFIPGIILVAMLSAGWSVALAIGSVGFAILWNISNIASISSSLWLLAAGLSATVGFLGLGTLGMLIMFFITKYIVLGVISYLQWNLKFILEK